MKETRGYSLDLRERVVEARREHEWTYAQTAAVFRIGVATVNRWFRRERETGSVAPKARGKGPPGLLNEDKLRLIGELVKEKPDRTIAQLVAVFRERQATSVSTSTMSRGLEKLGLSRKKKRSRPRSVSERTFSN